MLVPAVALPVTPIRVVAPLMRSSGRAKADKDRGGSRRNGGGRFELGDRRDLPCGDPAAAISSYTVLSALLDLPRGG